MATRRIVSAVVCSTVAMRAGSDFFSAHGYVEHGEGLVSPDVYAELVRSPDEGVAEFLDLSRVKPNTLGNTRMLKQL